MKKIVNKEIPICYRSRHSYAGVIIWLIIGIICCLMIFGIFIVIGASKGINIIKKNNQCNKENVYYNGDKIIVYTLEGPVHQYTFNHFMALNIHRAQGALFIDNIRVGYCSAIKFKDFIESVERIRNKTL